MNRILVIIFTTSANICTKRAIVQNTQAPVVALWYGAITEAIAVKKWNTLYQWVARRSLYINLWPSSYTYRKMIICYWWGMRIHYTTTPRHEMGNGHVSAVAFEIEHQGRICWTLLSDAGSPSLGGYASTLWTPSHKWTASQHWNLHCTHTDYGIGVGPVFGTVVKKNVAGLIRTSRELFKKLRIYLICFEWLWTCTIWFIPIIE